MGFERLISGKVMGKKERTDAQAKRLFKYSVDKFFADKNRTEKAKENYEKRGNGKYSEAGILARLFDIYSMDLSIKDIESKANVTSFMYGYYEAANLQLKLISNGIIPERVHKVLEASKAELHFDLTPDNILYDVGKRDALDEHIILTKLPDEVQSNKFYLEGYKESLIKLQERKKGR